MSISTVQMGKLRMRAYVTCCSSHKGLLSDKAGFDASKSGPSLQPSSH